MKFNMSALVIRNFDSKFRNCAVGTVHRLLHRGRSVRSILCRYDIAGICHIPFRHFIARQMQTAEKVSCFVLAVHEPIKYQIFSVRALKINCSGSSVCNSCDTLESDMISLNSVSHVSRAWKIWIYDAKNMNRNVISEQWFTISGAQIPFSDEHERSNMNVGSMWAKPSPKPHSFAGTRSGTLVASQGTKEKKHRLEIWNQKRGIGNQFDPVIPIIMHKRRVRRTFLTGYRILPANRCCCLHIKFGSLMISATRSPFSTWKIQEDLQKVFLLPAERLLLTASDIPLLTAELLSSIARTCSGDRLRRAPNSNTSKFGELFSRKRARSHFRRKVEQRDGRGRRYWSLEWLSI